jgi:L,D-transpeptidase ErfK/SrfK
VARRLVIATLFLSLATASLPHPADDAPARIVGGIADYVVQRGDTLRSISTRFGLDASTLAAENALVVDAKLTAGRSIRLDNRHIVPPALQSTVLVVNIPQRMVFHRGADGLTVGYPVAVGRRDWPTPVGTFVVSAMERHPTWNVPPSILEESRRQGRIQRPVVPPGPDNPLGDFWIGLSRTGIGIHATNRPSSIFRAVSHGCIRVHPDDMAQLFARVQPGTPGHIVYEPLLLADTGDKVYLEVHPDVYRRTPEQPRSVAYARAVAAGVADRIDWTFVEAVIAGREGVARDVTARSSRP